MARIELSNIGGGVTTLSLTTTGTSGASTLAGSVLNIPIYQGQLTLTTTGTSGAATLSGDVLNIPQYSGGGGTPAGSTGEVQFNNAGAFGSSSNLFWDNSNIRLGVGTSTPGARLQVNGSGLTSGTTALSVKDFGGTDSFIVRDDGSATVRSAFTAGGNLSVANNTFVAARSFGTCSIGSTTLQATSTLRIVQTTGSQKCFEIFANGTTNVYHAIESNGKPVYYATNTPSGTTGAQTIIRASGTVNFAAGASSLVVTNSLCTTSSIVFPAVRTNDTTAYIKNVVPAAGSFTINLGAAATAETSVGFFIIN